MNPLAQSGSAAIPSLRSLTGKGALPAADGRVREACQISLPVPVRPRRPGPRLLIAGGEDGHRSKRQRVAPFGSAVLNPTAVWIIGYGP